MNLQTFIQERRFIKKLLSFLFIFFFVSSSWADWTFDFSKRSKKMRGQEYSAENTPKGEESLIQKIFKSGSPQPMNEIVVLNTENGFIPKSIRVKEGQSYKINVVNVNQKEKNISFVLDSFSEHHSTYYGVIKSFYIQPKKEGVYSFQCPETSAKGKLVVYPNGSPARMRYPASEE